MANQVDQTKRSAIMAKVRSKDTAPEIIVRKRLHRAGHRFRIHRSDLPGTPDLVFPKYRFALFVHGCFWHRHGCKRTTMPASNVEFWSAKFLRTVERDCLVRQKLEEAGWKVEMIWECDLDAGIAGFAKKLAKATAPQD